jgi:hypothetical protein
MHPGDRTLRLQPDDGAADRLIGHAQGGGKVQDSRGTRLGQVRENRLIMRFGGHLWT